MEQALIVRLGSLVRVPAPFLLRSDCGLVFRAPAVTHPTSILLFLVVALHLKPLQRSPKLIRGCRQQSFGLDAFFTEVFGRMRFNAIWRATERLWATWPVTMSLASHHQLGKATRYLSRKCASLARRAAAASCSARS